jgi:polyketide synthase PksN
MDKVFKYIADNTGKGKIDKQVAIQLLMELQDQRNKVDDIAIIGMSVNMPFASDIQEFWENLRDGRDCIRDFPDSRRRDIDRYLIATGMQPQDVRYMKGAYLDHIDEFDYRFFHFAPKEASLMDPCQRLFMQTAWQAIEDAGYSGEQLIGSNTGVYIGFATTIKDSYQKLIYDTNPDLVPVSIVATLPAMIPTRLSYMLDLKGPTISVDTACSSSLVAVHLACREIQSGECDMAIVGGVKLHTVPLDKEEFRLGIESSDGRTRAFDDSSDGTGIGEGMGAILLKPYKKAVKDKDHIYAVIRGSAINQDGRSIGITAPNQISQAEVIVKAWENAGINPETISYIQTHGTGTELGDPIEIDGLRRAFEQYTNKKQFCAIGSVKTNVGHLYEGAGIINLISAALAVSNGQIPPTLHFCYPNRKINLQHTAVYVNDKLGEWKNNSSPKRCGVSSFGFSGTNCHVVLEEHTSTHLENNTQVGTPQIFVLSAKSNIVLKTLLSNYERWLSSRENYLLEDICFTACVGRDHHDHRIAFIANNMQEFMEKLASLGKYQINDISSHGCYWGSHDKRKESGMINDAAARVMKEFIAGGSRNAKKLEELCSLYTEGAFVDWNILYENRPVKRVSLPPYSFEQDRCWIEIDEQKYKNAIESHLFHGLSWKEKGIARPKSHNATGTILAFDDIGGKGTALLDELRSRGNRVVTVSFGRCFERVTPYNFVIENREEDYSRLLLELKEAQISQVLLLQTLSHTDEAPDIKTFENRHSMGVVSLFFLAKAVQRVWADHNTEIILVTARAWDVAGNGGDIFPEQAAMIGLGKVIGAETKSITCRNIDIDEDTCAEVLVDEVAASCKDYQICFREGTRYGQEFCRININEAQDDNTAVKEKGVYIITGGLGGIGIETAIYLSSKNRVNLILTGRTELPPEAEWERIQDDNSKTGLYNKISAIKQIRRTGSNVEYIRADISNEKDVESLLGQVKGKYGKIDGIVHSAGIAGNGFILGKTLEEFNRVLAPKVRGTWLIDRLTAKENLDFLILYSSGASFFGEPGQGDYTAANAFVDSFAEYRAGKGKKTLAINWVAWKETGMAFNYGTNKDTFFKAISTNKAICGLDAVFHKRINRVLIGEVNLCSKALHFLDRFPFDISDEISDFITSNDNGSFKDKETGTQCNVILKGKDHNEGYTDIEKIIGHICKETLGYKEVDVYENFFDLGGDSVLIAKMHGEIDKEFPGRLTIADMFSYSSVAKLAEHLAQYQNTESVTVDVAEQQETHTNTDIAVIGVAARYPQAEDIDEFWENMVRGKDCIIDFPEGRKRDISSYVSEYIHLDSQEMEYSKGGFLKDIDKFDSSFFRITPKEASYMDPNQRLFLETVWEAMEDAGYGGDRLTGTKTGVYVGFAKTTFDYDRLISDMQPLKYAGSVVGNLASIIPSRIAYLMDFRGPTAVVDTACSSSLVAVHMARRAIINGECDVAFAGGVKINLIPFKRNKENGVGIESSDDRTRTFDDSADGTGIGEGAGVVVLKGLKKAIEDGDHIYAVIKGSAVNQDGASASITSPNAKSQSEVLLAAWKDAGINAESLSYIEAHGTGTKLGDPIEIEAIKKAFAAHTDKLQLCGIGSVKTNIGHLYEGAGIASLLKSILVLRNKEIPPSLHFVEPNRRILFEASPVYVNDRLTPIERNLHPLRCAVSAFGFSGTNCHMVLEEAPVVRSEAAEPDTAYVIAISAKSRNSLSEILKSLIEKRHRWVNEELRDISFTLNTGRGHYSHRLGFIAKDKDDFIQKLEAAACSPDFAELPENMLYGEHRIRNANDLNNGIGDITNDEIRKLSNSANALIETLLADYKNNGDCLLDICKFYVSGANFEWDNLYTGMKAKRLSLPGYRFEKTRRWMDSPTDRSIDAPTDSMVNTEEAAPIHYYLEWVQEDMPSTGTIPTNGTYLVFEDEQGLYAEIVDVLRDHGNNVLCVTMGEYYRDIGDNRYEIGSSFDDYKKLIDSVIDINLTGIIHLSSIRKEMRVDSLESLEQSQQLGFYSLFYLSKAIASAGIQSDIQLTVISRYVDRVNHSEKYIQPENAPLFGFARSIPKEFSNVKCKCIDIDEITPITQVIGDFTQETGPYSVAYRAGERYTEEFREKIMTGTENVLMEFKKEGSYIITGGFGGMGIEMAKYLAAGGAGRIALISRTAVPQRDLWEDVLVNDPSNRFTERIRKALEIEKLGAEVLSFAADISDYSDVKDIIHELHKSYGRINGIIHCAGTTGHSMIIDKTDAQLRQILLPKIQGTWILDSLTNEDNLDFFIMASSVATMFSTAGQGDYAAANAYLDSFVQFRRIKEQHAMAINWVAWKEVGMAANLGFTYDTIFKAVCTKPAVEAFHWALVADVDRTLIGEINYQSRISQYIKNYTFRVSESILSKLDDSLKSQEPKTHESSGKLRLDGGENEGNYTEIEKTIAHILWEEMGYDDIDVRDNFFDMGGDSIILAKIRQKINLAYAGKVSITDLFEYPTIEKLAKFLGEQEDDDLPIDNINHTEDDSEMEAQIARMVEQLEEGSTDVDMILKDLDRI